MKILEKLQCIINRYPIFENIKIKMIIKIPSFVKNQVYIRSKIFKNISLFKF